MSTTRRTALKALGATGVAAVVTGCSGDSDGGDQTTDRTTTADDQTTTPPPTVDRVAADPRDVPPPVDRDEPRHHEISLRVEEVRAEVEPGVTYDYLTFGGQVPGPMIRVRAGDTVSFTLENPPDSLLPHNVDMHAVYGPGGGAEATTTAPGETASARFRAEYPGAFVYHCAVPSMDYHIASGMFGLILVEPREGLPPVDHELYFGQHELYTDRERGATGHHGFDRAAMAAEDPTYVLLNGEKYAITPDNHGAVTVSRGETARVYTVVGGPNLGSNFHPIGSVWQRAYRDGGLAGDPERYLQTVHVPPGSCLVGELEFPVPGPVKLVDHALSRVTRKGMLGVIDVTGAPNETVFDPDPEG